MSKTSLRKRLQDKGLIAPDKKENDFLILDNRLFFDTYLVVRYYNPDGKDIWKHYIHFIIKANGEERTYREVYQYFFSQENFLAAYGYVLNEDETGQRYMATMRYFRFTKEIAPIMSGKVLDKPLYYTKPQFRKY